MNIWGLSTKRIQTIHKNQSCIPLLRSRSSLAEQVNLLQIRRITGKTMNYYIKTTRSQRQRIFE